MVADAGPMKKNSMALMRRDRNTESTAEKGESTGLTFDATPRGSDLNCGDSCTATQGETSPQAVRRGSFSSEKKGRKGSVTIVR